MELDDGGAIGWRSNSGGWRFGIGQTSGGLFVFRTPSDPGTTSAPATYDLVINDTGNVGLGTTIASYPLTIRKVGYGWVHTDGLHELGSYVSGLGCFLGTRSTNDPLHFFTANSNEQMTLATSGDLGIGTNAPTRRLHVVDSDLFGARFETTNPGASVVEFRNTLADSTWEYGVSGTAPPFGLGAGDMYLYRQGNATPGMSISKDNFFATIHCADLRLGHSTRRVVPGRAMVDMGSHLVINFASDWTHTFVHGLLKTNVLEVAGADLAERFPSNEESVQPGTVMEIDPDHPGKLRVAPESYSSRVAGVVSGAGDLQAGAVLGNSEGSENGPAIALSGRVWVQCDAGSSAIAPGDLLTTSDTPGHAMKAVDRERSHGAVFGKAMSMLPKGERGLVLVLVNLQ